MTNSKNKTTERLASGHRMCPGCSIPIALKTILNSIDDPIITSNATGCSEICFGMYPFTAFKTPWIHSLFENSPSVISGLEALWKAKKRKKQLSAQEKKIKFLSIGGDGAVSDIGFQWLSGALERNTNALFVCFDNEGFMNTGNQRSSSTPLFSSTSTSPSGKLNQRKPLTEIMAAHKIPFSAQTTAAHFADLKQKAKKAFSITGPCFLNILCSCPTNWKNNPQESLEILKKAVETNFWPLFEVENGKWKINQKPIKKLPIEEFLKKQKRFNHLLKPENKVLLQKLQQEVDQNFNDLLAMENLKK